LGGGHAFYELHKNLGPGPRFLIAFGGILINLISGTAALFLGGRLDKGSPWGFFILLFGIISLLGSLAYTTLGFYYELGDPISWLQTPSPRLKRLWIPFLAVSPFASFYVMKPYADLNEVWYPARSYFQRAFTILMTLGITGCMYGALFVLTSQSSIAWDSPTLAHERAVQDIREAKKKAQYETLRAKYPELTNEEVRIMAEKTRIIIRPEEVPKKFPLKPVIAFLYLVGGMLASLNVKEQVPSSSKQISLQATLFIVVLAGSLLVYLAWTGGWVYGSAARPVMEFVR